MNFLYPLFFSSWLILVLGNAAGQGTIERYQGHIQTTVCMGTNISTKVSIPAPESALRRLKSGSAKRTQFLVTYHNFPTEAETAFQYALDIWSSVLYSSVPVRVDAYWENTLPTGVLGNTSPSSFYRRVPGAYIYEAFYPIVLAEKILGSPIGSLLDPDLEIHFSSKINWYFGTDASPDVDQYDLSTVALHEICHGLGFTGSFYVDANKIGSYGDGVNPVADIFDYYVKTAYSSANPAGYFLTDTNKYKNSSQALGSALTTLNVVYFDGVLSRKANIANNSDKVTLYSPRPWNQGSSIYHVGGKYYHTPNGLMYYAIDMQTAIHDPGAMLTGILGDLGWIHTWIHNDTLADIETNSAPRAITALIQSDTTISAGSFYLHKSYNNSGIYDSVQMSPTGNPNEYSGGITIPSLGTTVSYYLSVKDIFGRKYTNPSGAPTRYFRFFAGKDTIPPVILHQPDQLILNITDTLKISATVTDNIGVDTVYLEYKHNNDASLFRGLKNDSLSFYSVYLNLSAFAIVPGDSISYRIIAKDKSAAKNMSYSPASGFYVIPVIGLPMPATSYYTNFDTVNHDFIFNGFSISTPPGFNSPGLNSIHPYASPDNNNSHYDYTAQLRVPIIINSSNAFILFDEVALVEPGSAGAVFGSSNFYDYVIVEGSKDAGKTWNYFLPGWSCRDNAAWLTRFNSLLDANGNSLAGGDMSLYRKRQLDMLSSGHFKGGDTIMMRFRLYSDPYTFGWGWAIDNLNIQNIALGYSITKLTKTDMELFPNPASNELNIFMNLSEAPAMVQIQLINTLGEKVKDFSFYNPGHSIRETLSLEGLQRGVYLAVILIDGVRTIRKVSIIR